MYLLSIESVTLHYVQAYYKLFSFAVDVTLSHSQEGENSLVCKEEKN